MTAEGFNEWSKGHFPEYLGIEIKKIEGKSLLAEMKIKPQFLAPNTYLHAGAIVSFADTVAGYSVMLSLPEGAKSFTTIELKTNFIKTLKEGVVKCRSKAEHLGRTTQIWRVDVTNESEDKTLAIFTCTQMILY